MISRTVPRRRAFVTLATTAAVAAALNGGALTAASPGVAAAAVPASPRAETSRLAGVEMPKGAARFGGADVPFTGVLTSLSKEESIKRGLSGEAVEVYAWQGANYRADRVKFTRSALKRALMEAGWTVREITVNDIRDTNVFQHFSREDESLAFRPALTKQIEYFAATHEGKKRTVLGVWIESDDALAVGLMAVVFKTTKAAPLPPVAPGALLVKDVQDTMKGVALPKPPAFPKLAPKPRTVRGYTLDGGGRPLAGAKVAVHVSAGGGFRTTHRALSNAQGLYEVLLPVGVAEVVSVEGTVVYNGTKHTLPLLPATGAARQFNAQNGHVENYYLRTAAESGGSIRLQDNLNSGTVEVTLTPVGRMLDGSVGRTFVYRYPGSDSETYLVGMPLGRYKLTARLLDDGEALPLNAGSTFGTDAERAPAPSFVVDFKPGYTYSQYQRGKSNSAVQRVEVMLEP